ncbi:MAG: sigma-70 family RNA polymerase sigma factor [Deltaproteobacteria bacterium]|nr:sigma-70 family RNA polymerase sigma factor [Deltaproteobacteria bacterium]
MKGKPPPPDETTLLLSVVQGHPGAWNAFYGRYARLIVACIRKVLVRYAGPCSEADLEDVVNTVCLQLVRDDYDKLRRFDPGRGYRLSSWVGLIATNAAHDALRRRGPTTYSFDDPSASVPDLTEEGDDPAELTARREQLAVLNEAVKQLSPSEQAFLRYYYQEELEPEEIAELLGISVNTVYSRKNKVRTNLQRIIQELGSG